MLIEPLSSLQAFFPVFLAGALFFIGMAGVLMRRSLLMVLISLEILLNAVNLNLLAFSKIYSWEEGPVLIFFVICLAAVEAGVGLALAVRIYNTFKTTDIASLRLLKD